MTTPIQGTVGIGQTLFRAVLQRHHSPAASDADGIYRTFRIYNIDPSFGLAVFCKESKFGTWGIARETQNWGNIRYAVRPHRAFPERHPDGFVRYRSWRYGVYDFCDKLLTQYISEGRDTVEEIVPKWAPASDGNRPDLYITEVLGLMRAWSVEDRRLQK